MSFVLIIGCVFVVVVFLPAFHKFRLGPDMAPVLRP